MEQSAAQRGGAPLDNSELFGSSDFSDGLHVGGSSVSHLAISDPNGAGNLIPPVQALVGAFVFPAQKQAIAVDGLATRASSVIAPSENTANNLTKIDPKHTDIATGQILAQSPSQVSNENGLPNIVSNIGVDPVELVGSELVLEERGAAQRQGFFLGDVGVMVSYGDGSELTDMPPLYYLPNAPRWFLGMANLHGNMVPVFDLVEYLCIDQINSEQEKQEDKRMLLVLSHGSDAAGVIVHGIPQRLYIMQEQNISPDVAPNLLLPHISNAYLIDSTVWFDLEVESLLAALEGAMRAM